MTDQTTVQALAQLLAGVHATPVIQSGRLAPSTLYDVDYRLAIVACAFDAHGKKSRGQTRRISAARLKLLQFIAARPMLLPVIQEWSAAGRQSQRNLLAPHSLRRGFLGDRTHDKVVFYLTAHNAIRREKGYLVESARTSVLLDLAARIKAADLFGEERRVLDALSNTTLTLKMLEGQ